ncbi:cGMP-inhibited 3, 5 -cyclic phosphodiesterase B [Pelobates cultripes]|uniref:cGMP-inhibited 3,5 -cyclic phosphodiesterase B n=1 Tax=Pelobates cultripes TaxID=61616 RepID=A0AAD1T8P9_PELCU|nr:cGMP-inhibited 3, 5 -cyclic phosphodiesterase B [Pelobates cultripes]
MAGHPPLCDLHSSSCWGTEQTGHCSGPQPILLRFSHVLCPLFSLGCACFFYAACYVACCYSRDLLGARLQIVAQLLTAAWAGPGLQLPGLATGLTSFSFLPQAHRDLGACLVGLLGSLLDLSITHCFQIRKAHPMSTMVKNKVSVIRFNSYICVSMGMAFSTYYVRGKMCKRPSLPCISKEQVLFNLLKMKLLLAISVFVIALSVMIEPTSADSDSPSIKDRFESIGASIWDAAVKVGEKTKSAFKGLSESEPITKAKGWISETVQKIKKKPSILKEQLLVSSEKVFREVNSSYTMQMTVQIWSLALVFLLGIQVSGLTTDMQSDDWRVSTILESTLDQYVRPYTKPVYEKVTNSGLWTFLGQAVDRVQGAVNLTSGYLNTYYEDHLEGRVENAKQWIQEKTKPIIESVQQRFQKESN